MSIKTAALPILWKFDCALINSSLIKYCKLESRVKCKVDLLYCLFFTSLATSVAVSVSGILAFVGLVVPHIVRLIVGNDNRQVLPLSAFFGGFFVVLMDYVTRIFFSSSDLRVGVFMSLIGGPFFIFLIFF